MALNQSRRAFTQGVELRGPLSLAVTRREGAPLPKRNNFSHAKGTLEEVPELDSDLGSLKSILSEVDEEEVLARTLRLISLLWDATDVRAPNGTPCEGKVANFDNAHAFVSCYCKFLHSMGREIARPQVTFHWTAEENFMSIIENNLMVPHPDSGIKKKHGAAFGRGIYTCPDYKMAKEDFSYGSSATFVCLALVGRQLTRHHGKGNGLLECRGNGFDSVVGRLTNRYCDTWVFPDSSQILPCFLVDEVAIPAAVDKLREAIALLHEPWPEGEKMERSLSSIRDYSENELAVGAQIDSAHSPSAQGELSTACASDAVPARWRRRERSENDSPVEQQSVSEMVTCESRSQELPYNGDLQAAIRAQDRLAVAFLLKKRDNRSASSYVSEGSEERGAAHVIVEASSEKNVGRRWGSKMSTIVDDKNKVNREETKKFGSLIQKGGDLLKAGEQYIVHQCNCVIAGAAQGIAEVIFREYPDADVYRERAEHGRPHDFPGTLSIHGAVINFYAQLLPGRPADDAPPGGWLGTNRYVNAAQAAKDTRESRFRWFVECLSMLRRALPDNSSHSIAFPARIGCGLAGGQWSRYLDALTELAKNHPSWQVVIYDNEMTPGMVFSEPVGNRAQAVCSRISSKKNSGSACSNRFWYTAVFEALRDGAWQPYDDIEQESLRRLMRSCDDCDEALVDAQRNASLALLAEAGVTPKSFGTLSTSSHDASNTGATGNLELKLQRTTGNASVSLAPIATCGGLGEERSQASDAGTLPCPVRLRLPAVREGELRLPSDLDECMSAPTPSECGRVIQSIVEIEALGDSHCGICIEEFSPKRNCSSASRIIQLSCGHPFHEACLTRWFEERRRCPTCKRRFGHIVGNQPCLGTMSWKLVSDVRLAGFPDSFTIMMQFRFPPGKDAAGQQYKGRSQPAYLPHDEGGKLMLELFKLAFRRRVLFDLRISSTDNKYWPAFNIHLKTATSGGPQRFGYPDDGYYQRAMEELRENGLTVADLI